MSNGNENRIIEDEAKAALARAQTPIPTLKDKLAAALERKVERQRGEPVTADEVKTMAERREARMARIEAAQSWASPEAVGVYVDLTIELDQKRSMFASLQSDVSTTDLPSAIKADLEQTIRQLRVDIASIETDLKRLGSPPAIVMKDVMQKFRVARVAVSTANELSALTDDSLTHERIGELLKRADELVAVVARGVPEHSFCYAGTRYMPAFQTLEVVQNLCDVFAQKIKESEILKATHLRASVASLSQRIGNLNAAVLRPSQIARFLEEAKPFLRVVEKEGRGGFRWDRMFYVPADNVPEMIILANVIREKINAFNIIRADEVRKYLVPQDLRDAADKAQNALITVLDGQADYAWVSLVFDGCKPVDQVLVERAEGGECRIRYASSPRAARRALLPAGEQVFKRVTDITFGMVRNSLIAKLNQEGQDKKPSSRSGKKSRKKHKRSKK